MFYVEESVYGNYVYHIRQEDEEDALCGAQTLYKKLPIKLWGVKQEHLPTSYCKDCERIWKLEQPTEEDNRKE